MNYREARAYIEEIPRNKGELGLDAIRALLDETGHPERKLSFIHIAGTNGKGSVLSHISTVLTYAGYRVGRYISPTLYSYRERIQVNGGYISREDFTRLTEVIREGVKRMEAKGLSKPSPFELETVLGFLYFAQQRCDYVVLECGLGGLNDATNVIPMENKKAAVLTSISMDHMEYLGDTLEKIAIQKAGILAPGVLAVSAPQKQEVREALEDYGHRNGCRIKITDSDGVEILEDSLDGQRFWYDGQIISIGLAGKAQVENAITAYETLKLLRENGVYLEMSQILEGMKKTRWNGRFTKICSQPPIYVDGAHNPDAALKLQDSILRYFAGKRLIYINGMFSDKDYETVVRITAPLAEQIFTIATPGSERALSPEKLAEAIRPYNGNVIPCKSIQEAVNNAKEAAAQDGVILTFGSLSFIGELTTIVEKNQ